MNTVCPTRPDWSPAYQDDQTARDLAVQIHKSAPLLLVPGPRGHCIRSHKFHRSIGAKNDDGVAQGTQQQPVEGSDVAGVPLGLDWSLLIASERNTHRNSADSGVDKGGRGHRKHPGNLVIVDQQISVAERGMAGKVEEGTEDGDQRGGDQQEQQVTREGQPKVPGNEECEKKREEELVTRRVVNIGSETANKVHGWTSRSGRSTR